MYIIIGYHTSFVEHFYLVACLFHVMSIYITAAYLVVAYKISDLIGQRLRPLWIVGSATVNSDEFEKLATRQCSDSANLRQGV